MKDFLTSPLSFTRDQRTSRDVCRDATAIQTFPKRMTLSEKCLYVVAALAVVALAIII